MIRRTDIAGFGVSTLQDRVGQSGTGIPLVSNDIIFADGKRIDLKNPAAKEITIKKGLIIAGQEISAKYLSSLKAGESISIKANAGQYLDPREAQRHLAREMHMLVLSRKRNESVIIDDNIVVTVIEVRGDKVRLGIEAPKDMDIHRYEVWAAIQRDKPQEPTASGQTETATENPTPAESDTDSDPRLKDLGDIEWLDEPPSE